MKFDMRLWPATETSWVVLYGGQTIPKWRTAAILKIGILSPYLSEKSSDFHEILYKAADFELDERHVIKDEKNCNGQTPSSTARISCFFKFRKFSFLLHFSTPVRTCSKPASLSRTVCLTNGLITSILTATIKHGECRRERFM